MDGSLTQLNKTVVILTPGFPADESDTTCIPALQDYVKCLHEEYSSLQIFVLAFQYPQRSGWYKWNGIDVFSAGGNDSKYIARINTWLKIFHQLKSINKKNKIHVVHSFWLNEATLVGQQFVRRKNIHHISTLFGQDSLPSNKYLHLLNFRKMTIVANSEFTARTFQKTTHHHTNDTIHFGLAEEKTSHVSLYERKYDIVGVGSLIPLKNYGLFIEIIKEVKSDFPNLKTLLIGEGVERKKLEELILKFTLQDTIELKGAIQRRDVLHLLRQSKIFLHTSGYESAGYVFLESLSCGCELVCFDVGYISASAKSHICVGKEEMIEKIKFLLTQDLNYESVPVITMKETVKKFAELYSAIKPRTS